MKSIYTILTTLKADAELALPGIFYAHGIANMEVYEIGQSRDDRKKSFHVYQDKLADSVDRVSFTFAYQLQLPGVNVLDAAKYADAVMEWIKAYNFQRVGFPLVDMIDIDTWPNTRDRTTVIFFDITISDPIDSCD